MHFTYFSRQMKVVEISSFFLICDINVEAKCGTLRDLWKLGKYESRLCGGTCGNKLNTMGDREIRCGRVWKEGQKANGPNRQFRKGLWMWSNLIPRGDQGEMEC